MDILSNVPMFAPTLYEVDNSSLIKTQNEVIANANARNEKANQQYAQLVSALNQYDIAPEDEHFRNGALNEIQQIVDNNSTMLGTGAAYNALLKQGTDIGTNKFLRAAVINKKAYDDFKNKIENDETLDRHMKDYYLNINKYNGVNFGDIHLEKNGDIEYIDRWEPKINPVQQVNYNDYAKKVLTTFMNNDKTKTKFATDSNGTPIRDLNQLSNGMYMWNEKTNAYEACSKEDVLDFLVSNTHAESGLDDSLMASYDAGLYSYDNAENKDAYLLNGQDKYGVVKNGMRKDYEQYVRDLFEPIASAYAFEDETNMNDWQIQKPGKLSSGSATETSPYNNIPIQSQSTNIHYIDNPFNRINDNISVARSSIASMLETPIDNQGNTLCNIDYKNGIISFGNRQYNINNLSNDRNTFKNELLDYAKQQGISDENIMRLGYNLDTQLDVLSENEYQLNNFRSTLTPDQQIYYDAFSRVQNGGVIYGGTQEEKNILDSIDNIFVKYNSNDNSQERYLPSVETFYLGNQAKSIISQIYENNPNALNFKSINFDISNGKFTIRKSANIADDIFELGRMLEENGHDANSLFDRFCYANDKNTPSGDNADRASRLNSAIKNINKNVKQIKEKCNKSNKGAIGDKTYILGNYITGDEDVTINTLREQFGLGKTADYNSVINTLIDRIYTTVNSADGAMLKMYKINKDGTYLEEVQDSEDKITDMRAIQGQISNSKDNISITTAFNAGEGYGHIITIHNNKNTTNSKAGQEGTRYFIKGLIDSEIMQQYEKDNTVKAMKEIGIAQQTENSYIRLNNQIKNNYLGDLNLTCQRDGNFTLNKNGKPIYENITADMAINLKSCSLTYNEVLNRYKNGIEITDSDKVKIINDVIEYAKVLNSFNFNPKLDTATIAQGLLNNIGININSK